MSNKVRGAVIRGGRLHVPLKESVLERFPETVRRLGNCLELSDEERATLKGIEDRCQRELERMKQRDAEVRAQVKLLDQDYERQSRERIENTHRKSKFTDYTPRAPGSAFKPK